MEKNQPREAWKTFSVVATVMTVIISVLIVLGEVFAHKLVLITNPGFAHIPHKVDDTVHLTRILLPAQLCFFLGGLMMGSLTARHIFIGQALGPIIYNIGIIIGGIFLTQTYGVAGLCFGAVGGALIGNLLLQWILVRRSGGYFVPPPIRETWTYWKQKRTGEIRQMPATLAGYWKHPGARKVWRLMLPVILGLALPPISTIINKMFASTLGNGPQSALMNANKLMNIPIAIFGQAAGIAIFPTMAAQAARKDMVALRRSVNFGVRSILFLTIPASVFLIILSMPMVQLMLQTGKFSHEDAEIAAAALRSFAVGVFAWSTQAVVARGFYALQDTRTPVIVGTLVTILFFTSNWLLIHFLHNRPFEATAGLALLTSISASVLMLVLLVLLGRRLCGLNMRRIAVSTAKILIASLVAGVVAFGVRIVMEQRMPVLNEEHPGSHVFFPALLLLSSCMVTGAICYLGIAWLLKMEETAVLIPVMVRLKSPFIKLAHKLLRR
jgi:putative peptidoglycan lipid II flippase